MSTRGDKGYAAPAWLPGGHLQTIFPAKLVRLPRVEYRRERWDAPDGDFIEVDFALPNPPTQRHRCWFSFTAWKAIRAATIRAY